MSYKNDIEERLELVKAMLNELGESIDFYNLYTWDKLVEEEKELEQKLNDIELD